MAKRPKDRADLNAAIRRGVAGKRDEQRSGKRFERWAKGRKPKDAES